MTRVQRHVLDEPQLEPMLAGEPCQRHDVFLGLPRIATALIFTGSNPAALAAIIPSITRSTPGRRVSRSNRAGSSVSRLMLIRFRPASRNVPATGASRIPLVVKPTSSSPEIATSFSTNFGRSRRHQWFAPSQPHLIDPQRHRHAGDPLDFLERQQIRSRQEPYVLRHAVDAADIAAVGDADPQVVVRPSPRVDELIESSCHRLILVGLIRSPRPTSLYMAGCDHAV